MTKPVPEHTDATAELLRRAAFDEAPPAAVRARALALRGATQRVAGQAATLLRRLVAVLVPQGGVAPLAPAFGVRGGAALVRQWLFRADECEIDLRTQPRGERWLVAGQLFGAPQAERVVLAGHAGSFSAAIGATCEFSFAEVPAGRYSLTVQGGELEVVVPRFDVGEAEAAT